MDRRQIFIESGVEQIIIINDKLRKWLIIIMINKILLKGIWFILIIVSFLSLISSRKSIERKMNERKNYYSPLVRRTQSNEWSACNENAMVQVPNINRQNEALFTTADDVVSTMRSGFLVLCTNTVQARFKCVCPICCAFLFCSFWLVRRQIHGNSLLTAINNFLSLFV